MGQNNDPKEHGDLQGQQGKQPKDAMRASEPKHPGLERDNKGNVIPMSKRLPQDRAAARRSAKRKKK